MADVTIRTLLNVKSVPISPLHPEVPKTIFDGFLFSLANFSIINNKPLFFETSERIVFQHEEASLKFLPLKPPD